MNLGIYAIGNVVYFRVCTVDQDGSGIDATSGPTYRVYRQSGTSALATGTMTLIDSGNTEGFYEASFTLTSSTFSTGQHFIYITATVDGQTPTTTLSFQTVAADQSVVETFQSIETINESMPNIGDGSVSIDHNYGGTDNYRVLSSTGTPIADVVIRAFAYTDYTGDKKSNDYVIGQAETQSDGRWKTVIRLDPGKYVLEFSKRGAFTTRTDTLTVS